MTTRLAGKDTVFLPFNRGNGHHAGNPPIPNQSPTSYLWETILQRDTWLEILDRFMHLEITEKRDPDSGRTIRKETLPVPALPPVGRRHQAGRCRTHRRPGTQVLIQHLQGPEKTNSISWLAQRLASLYDDNDERCPLPSSWSPTGPARRSAAGSDPRDQPHHRLVAHIDGLRAEVR